LIKESEENFEGNGALIKSLGNEVLERYREINLLYGIGEKISADNSIEATAGILLNEIRRVVKSGYASFLLNKNNSEGFDFKEIAFIGKVIADKKMSSIYEEIKKINEKAYKTGKGFIEKQKDIYILVSPLIAGRNKRIIGFLNLCSYPGEIFTAANLSFLSVISSYVSNFIELFRLYEYEKETAENLKAKNMELKNAKKVLTAENKMLKKSLTEKYSAENITGISDKGKALAVYIEKIAGLSSSVLITGETGTGKEFAAKAIHYSGDRRDKPFIAVNCSAIPESIFESELFGIEKGVATGVINRKGKLLEADGGTLFLDEIGDMPLAQQAKLLRVIEEKEVIPLGGNTPVKFDVRFIAATNKNLKKETANGNFREDLFYRLNVLNIELPPLRERREDIPLLVKHFISIYSERLGKSGIKISDRAMDILKDYGYPGNIRELKNEIEKIVSLLDSREINVQNISEHIIRALESCKTGTETYNKETVEKTGSNFGNSAENDPLSINPVSLKQKTYNIGESEKELIKVALSSSNGNKSAAAKKLGISREGLRLKMKKLGLQS